MEKKDDYRGFTLIEIIISIAILGMVMLVFTSILSLGNNINQQTLLKTRGSMEAATNMENLVLEASQTAMLEVKFEGLNTINIDGERLISTSTTDNVEYVSFQASTPIIEEPNIPNPGDSANCSDSCDYCRNYNFSSGEEQLRQSIIDNVIQKVKKDKNITITESNIFKISNIYKGNDKFYTVKVRVNNTDYQYYIEEHKGVVKKIQDVTNATKQCSQCGCYFHNNGSGKYECEGHHN